MSFVVKQSRLVEEDQLEAANWYDRRQPGLGDDFLDETEAVVSQLSESALLYAARFEGSVVCGSHVFIGMGFSM
jgi:hypothetical protein